jgi:hypothetical protein
LISEPDSPQPSEGIRPNKRAKKGDHPAAETEKAEAIIHTKASASDISNPKSDDTDPQRLIVPIDKMSSDGDEMDYDDIDFEDDEVIDDGR